MSRTLFSVDLKIQAQNGQSGIVHLQADHLVTMREIRAVLEKAMRMCETMNAETPAEEMPRHQQFKVVG
jgi:hypothetical protein